MLAFFFINPIEASAVAPGGTVARSLASWTRADESPNRHSTVGYFASFCTHDESPVFQPACRHEV